MNRDLYRPARLLGEEQADALWRAWLTLSVDATRHEHGPMRRRYAERTRSLIAAFGERIDGRCSPFSLHLPSRLRCERCKRSVVTRAPILETRIVRKDGSVADNAWYCVDCLNTERRFCGEPWWPYARVDIVGLTDAEATCAA